jgi:hypothetical protein
MFKGIIIVFSLVLGATTVYAEDTSVSFSSAYTYLSKECKWAYSESELSEGQDNALLCRGFGKYQIYIYFSAMNSWLSIRLKDDPDPVIFESAIGGIDEKKGVVEWRMANGIPFAIIVRSREYSNQEEGRKLLQESMVVRGLGQYSKISGFVHVSKNMNANEKARRLADDGFNKRLRIPVIADTQSGPSRTLNPLGGSEN